MNIREKLQAAVYGSVTDVQIVEKSKGYITVIYQVAGVYRT